MTRCLTPYVSHRAKRTFSECQLPNSVGKSSRGSQYALYIALLQPSADCPPLDSIFPSVCRATNPQSATTWYHPIFADPCAISIFRMYTQISYCEQAIWFLFRPSVKNSMPTRRFSTVDRRCTRIFPKVLASRAHFAHDEQQSFARQPEVGQCKQGDDLPRLLLESAVAKHHEAELALDDPEGMLDDCPHHREHPVEGLPLISQFLSNRFLGRVRMARPSSRSKHSMVRVTL